MAHRGSMASISGPVEYKKRATEEAKLQQRATAELCQREGIDVPQYDFLEFIGKGSYGRVYKSLRKVDNTIVAVKVLESDLMDYETPGPEKDIGIRETLKEIEILRRIQDSNAVNVNKFVEAFSIHSQLWIVNEYCSGGSITTLRRATKNKLSERHIIAIARETAKGLKSVHDAGIVHRDIKCSNIMINEQGHVKIIDFGVSGVLLSNLEEDKRKTVIGTPHWMAPEIQRDGSIAHGYEVDVWSYGITIYECVMGAPPHAATQGRLLKSRIRQQEAPRLPDTKCSSDLADFVASVLVIDPIQRPAMEDICKFPFIADSEGAYPTESLRELVEVYYLWEVGGGQRASLWMAGGAAQPKLAGNMRGDDDDEEWTFSTTDKFEQKQAPVVARMSMNPNFSFGGDDFADLLSSSPPRDFDDEPFNQPTARYGIGGDIDNRPASKGKGQSSNDLNNETRVARGAKAMQGLFDYNATPYSRYAETSSDLPLRSDQTGSSFHRKEVSVSSSDGGAPNINLDNIPKISAKRATMQWKWDENLGGSGTMPPMPSAGFAGFESLEPPTRPQLKHSVTEPVGVDRPQSTTLDLDDLMGFDTVARKSQMYATPSWNDTSSSTFAPMTPIPADDDAEIGFTLRPGHGPSDSMASSNTAPSDLGTTAVSTANASFSSLKALPQDRHTSTRTSRISMKLPVPVDPSALIDGASNEVMLAAMETQINQWTSTLEAFDQLLLQQEDDSESDSDDDLESYATSSKGGSGDWNHLQDEEGSTAGDDEAYHGEGENTGDEGTD